MTLCANLVSLYRFNRTRLLLVLAQASAQEYL